MKKYFSTLKNLLTLLLLLSASAFASCVTEEINFGVNPTKYNTCIKSYLSNNNTSYTTNYSVKVNFNNT